ncbi:ornithine carbamoyltransferase [Clostridium felsineum]|uniref:Ornithine carbamoyltransferase n=1 Tax=Clostridium felsineum TaxID=36839 RepID=A0A1S8LVJ0_9CLOT|nr:ornithine carbamoyltransferase [Clostridium felsineum]MCR3761003.1 ornithine carbamoyltransferase [Clostridium felsineum]URZ02404.1 Ornithine carbamoyltransferase [Clostridium felsineum]URZ04858.1 Ornithine carbamoyltransferase [Clostridium felsineum]URZ09899.1 Ornithine carbamoyltransferase [Clostridium felsineum]
MGYLKNRNFLSLLDFTPEDINYMLDLGKKLKEDKKNGVEEQYLKKKNIALIFEKDSTRTRCSFEVAAHDQGAHAVYIGSTGSQISKKESIKDTARVLGRMFDAIEYRGYGQEVVEILAEHSKVPVWNGLTDEEHPTQVIANFMTLKEKFNKPLNQIKFVYCGDGRNNVSNALMIGAAKMGMDFRIAAPKSLFPDQELVEKCIEICKETGGKITLNDDVDEVVLGADVLYTDVWVSMGEDREVWKQRLNMLKPYQINMDMINKTKNPDVKFMHCLPAFHDFSTDAAKEIFEEFNELPFEVTDEVFESDYSLAFDEAENRLHSIKAIMVATLGDV